MKSIKDAVALCEIERDNFYVTAFMIEAWLGQAICGAVAESKQFQEAKAGASQLELATGQAGVITAKKSSQPVRGTNTWDDAMIKARGQTIAT